MVDVGESERVRGVRREIEMNRGQKEYFGAGVTLQALSQNTRHRYYDDLMNTTTFQHCSEQVPHNKRQHDHLFN